MKAVLNYKQLKVLQLLSEQFSPSSEQLHKHTGFATRNNSDSGCAKNPEIIYQEVTQACTSYNWFILGVIIELISLLVFCLSTTVAPLLLSAVGMIVGFPFVAQNFWSLSFKKRHVHEVAFVQMWSPIRKELLARGIVQQMVKSIFPRDKSMSVEILEDWHQKTANEIITNGYSIVQDSFEQVLFELALKAVKQIRAGKLADRTKTVDTEMNPLIDIRITHFLKHTDKGSLFSCAEKCLDRKS
ncbi:MAG: hypothetical protein K9M11_04860 [Candidatus Pacebacteria bacterium]|nr:hypothetical protein [Candidatus Paceibacterota bacterium]